MGTANTDRSFDNQVFINCPFDNRYKKLFYAYLYTVFACGFYPVTALEYNDGLPRLDKIYDQIKGSRFGIHDVSLVTLDSKNKLPRFNMPFELGVDFGCRKYGNTAAKRKRFLIFESSKHKLNEYLSDLAGCDPVCHQHKPEKLITEVRNWLHNTTSEMDEYYELPGEIKIQEDFIKFYEALPDLCKDSNLTPTSISYITLINFMRGWANRAFEDN